MAHGAVLLFQKSARPNFSDRLNLWAAPDILIPEQGERTPKNLLYLPPRKFYGLEITII